MAHFLTGVKGELEKNHQHVEEVESRACETSPVLCPSRPDNSVPEITEEEFLVEDERTLAATLEARNSWSRMRGPWLQLLKPGRREGGRRKDGFGAGEVKIGCLLYTSDAADE